MDRILYGVDTSRPVTPMMVRDAMMVCFRQAHDEILDGIKEFTVVNSDEELEDLKSLNVKYMIESMFKDVGADFNHPQKRDIMKVLDKLREYSSKFKDAEIVDGHYSQIFSLVDLLE